MAPAARGSGGLVTRHAPRSGVRGPRAEGSLRSQPAVDSVMVISVRLVPRPTRAAASGRCALPDAVGGDRLLKESACLAPSRGERGGHDHARAMARLPYARHFPARLCVEPGDVAVDEAGGGSAA